MPNWLIIKVYLLRLKSNVFKSGHAVKRLPLMDFTNEIAVRFHYLYNFNNQIILTKSIY
jgi:hypothetical protein